MSKDNIIAEVYYDERHGFGSIQHTLKRAREKDSKITLDDVKVFLESLSEMSLFAKHGFVLSSLSCCNEFEIEGEV